jgi:Flp pilus assembly protein TadG
MRGVRLRSRRRRLGQAMVETALLAPILLVLLLGGMQVAYLGYDAVTIDTAAREGARVAVENAQTSLSFSSTSPTSYTCAANPASDSNPVCKAVAQNAGLLNGQNFALVRIDTYVTVAQRPPDTVPGDVMQVGSCSNNNDAQFAGTISPGYILPVTDSLGDSTSSDGSGNFTLCMHGTGSTTQTVSISVSGTYGGQTCNGSTSTSISKSGSQWTASPSSGTVYATCTTPAATTSSSSSSSTTSSSSFTMPNFSFVPHSSSDTCTEVPTAGTYITVTVEYQASVLVPLLNSLLADSGKNYKTMKSVVTMRVEPCTT